VSFVHPLIVVILFTFALHNFQFSLFCSFISIVAALGPLFSVPHQPTSTTTKTETTKTATTAKCQLQGREGHVGKAEFPEAHGHPRGLPAPGEGEVRTVHADPGAALSGQMCRVQRGGLG